MHQVRTDSHVFYNNLLLAVVTSLLAGVQGRQSCRYDEKLRKMFCCSNADSEACDLDYAAKLKEMEGAETKAAE